MTAHALMELAYDPADPDKMKLPAETTCGDCVHIRRCKAIFGHVETDTCCDWSPSRFHRAVILMGEEEDNHHGN